jgi:hypothetical protein
MDIGVMNYCIRILIFVSKFYIQFLRYVLSLCGLP